LRYLKQLLEHKWHVFRYAWKLGIPFLGLVHDMSKFRPSEFFAHADYFGRDEPSEDKKRLDLAWNRHLKRNKHHWQYWTAQGDNGITTLFEMPDRYRKEMFADWLARARFRDKQHINMWYLVKQHSINLHPLTRHWVEYQMRTRAW
jgi:hypothetical protein